MMLMSIAAVLVAVLVVVTGAWGTLALWQRLRGRTVAVAVALAWQSACVAGWIALALGHAGGAAALVLLFAGLAGWWATIRPRADRPWADDVARQVVGEVDGDRVVLRGIRDFRWRSDDDYDIRWHDATYRLSELVRVDAVVSYWSGPAIAHAMASFGFGDGRHVVFSMEIRRKRGEAFSEIGGFFKQFELVVVAAEERDIIGVRTNVRGEDDYLFPLRMKPEAMRSLFLSYVKAANRLARRPRFYHTVTSNCTTIVYRMAKRIDRGLPFDIRLLMTGYLPEYLMDTGALDRRYDMPTWRRLARITDRARAASPETFSAAIREGLPPAYSPGSATV